MIKTNKIKANLLEAVLTKLCVGIVCPYCRHSVGHIGVINTASVFFLIS